MLACLGIKSSEQRRALAGQLAAEAGFSASSLKTSEFRLQAFWRLTDSSSSIVHVYIEGDGYAWRSRRSLSEDPTPQDPVSLRLAIADPADNVIYLARPCMYQPAGHCDSKWWSSHRYSQTVVENMSQAIDLLLSPRTSTSLRLTGYSGGGTLAALLAARRDDVKELVTVAANLDHRSWTSLHGVSELSESLNPVDDVQSLSKIPQIHYAGADDKTVPEEVQQAYMRRLADGAPARLKIMPGFDHDCCWVEAWPRLLQLIRGDFAEGQD